jgi:hypothetical protein
MRGLTNSPRKIARKWLIPGGLKKWFWRGTDQLGRFSGRRFQRPPILARDLDSMPLEHLFLPMQRLVIGVLGHDHLR